MTNVTDTHPLEGRAELLPGAPFFSAEPQDFTARVMSFRTRLDGGEGRIRTYDASMARGFATAAFSHSATSPYPHADSFASKQITAVRNIVQNIIVHQRMRDNFDEP